MSAAVVLVSASTLGHRAAYLSLFSTLLHGVAQRPDFRLVFERRPVFFLMIEEHFVLYVLVSLCRALSGRKTLGLLFRPGPALAARSWRAIGKSLMLKMMRRVASASTFSIVPFHLEPGFATLADDWIYDPQLWDLSARDIDRAQSKPASDLLDFVSRVAGNRRVVSAIGAQTPDKGFDLFAQSFAAAPDLRRTALFVAAGQVAPAATHHADQLLQAGGVVLDRVLSDGELLDVYGLSDAIWCAYAPSYDQSSGIFGRAVQLGIPAIVRSGSLIHRQCLHDHIAHLAVSRTGVAETIMAHMPCARDVCAARSEGWRASSVAKIAAALGVGP